MNVDLFQLLRGYLRGFAWLALPMGAALLAYLVCTAIRVPDPLRWYVTGGAFFGLLLICGVVFLIKWIRKRKRGASLEDALGQGPGGSVAQQGEINALRKQWKESLSTLKASGVGGGGTGALAALPWFVIIGEPASGKSTLLRQSGIDFPVGDAAIRGLQGTRNCDWWFSNIGVFLDTAGRYVSDASAGEWASFLELVRKHRTGSPINGVIVAVPAPDLVSKGLDQLDFEARRIRARLDELIDHLGVNFPVWVTLTKVDLIAGFAEFFGQADAQTRRQMMGWTLDQAQGMRFDRQVFDRYFQATVHRLREIRPVLIQKAKLRDRPAAYAFPDELGSLGDALGSMLSKMFEPNIYQDTPFFRGLYITSATQQGTPLQRAAQHIREMLGAPGAPPDPHQAIIKHAYFVKDLMNDRVVSDREMTWTTKREIERNKTRRLGQNLAGASFGVLLAFVVLAFGANARNELSVVKDNFEQATPAAGAVERSDALWFAAVNASDDPYRNLGLSQQRTLKQELEVRQRKVYYEEVLEALVKGYEEDARLISIEDGLDELIEHWQEFRYARAALQRALLPFAPPPALDPLTDEDGNPIEEDWEDPYAIEAPIDFFYGEEIDAFIARAARLESDGVIGSQDEEVFPRLLLLAIWRNGTEPVAGRLDTVRGIYLEKLFEYLSRAAAEVVDMGAWRDGFRMACQESLLTMEAPRVERDQLRARLDAMFERASGPPKRDDGGGAPEFARLDPTWRGTLPGDLETLEIAELIDRGELMTQERFEGLVPYFDGTAASGGAPSAHLLALAKALDGLRKQADQPRGLASGPWGDRGKNIADVLDHIDEEVKSRSGQWADGTVPHLLALAEIEKDAFEADEKQWGHAVEHIESGIRRDDLLKAFFEIDAPSAFPALADEIVASRKRKAVSEPDDPSHFNRSSMGDALRELAKVSARTRRPEYFPDVAGSLQARAETEVEQRFGQLVDGARAHWDAKCKDLPPYTGDAVSHLTEWVDPKGRIVVLAKHLETLYKKSWPISDELRDDPAAKKAWDRTSTLRTRYAFFWTDLGKVQKELQRHLDLRDVQLASPPASSQLKRLDGELPGGAGPKKFTVAAWLAPDTNRLITDSSRQALDRAVDTLLFEVLEEVKRYYNTQWSYAVEEVQSLIGSDSKVEKNAAFRRMKEHVREMQILFGPSLRHNRDGLTANAGVLGAVNEVERRFAATKVEASARLTFDCVTVPTGAGADAFPFVVLEYRTRTGGAIKSAPWQPNQTRPWDDIVWKQGEDDVFAIYMVAESGPGRVPFRKWTGTDCLRRAIQEGGGGDMLVWTGEGDFAGREARFSLSVSDRRLFRILMGGEATGGGGGTLSLPQDCVRLDRRR